MMGDEVPIQSRDYWFKVIEMLQQNWALIDVTVGGVTVYFVIDAGGVFDEITYDSLYAAETSLTENGCQRFADDPKVASFLYPLNPPFFYSHIRTAQSTHQVAFGKDFQNHDAK